ncbi:MAG: hypothetical protein M3139_13815 [Bacteroidota bacterium]|nr:hypothetical protein [Bacteroidota bacterium]
MAINVGIGFVTGRKHFQNVLTSYINNWIEHGLLHDKAIRLHLFVAYDLKYAKTEISDYKNMKPELAAMVQSVNYYGKETIEKERRLLESAGVVDKIESELLFGEGYAKKRNAVIHFAKKNKMDKLIFLDDDEYPVATMKNKYNNLIWMGQSVVGTHLKYISDADITHGHHCGYISPIPSIPFNDVLTENTFKLFIEAISNEIISWDVVKNNIIINKGVTYANPDIINERQVVEVNEVSGMKFISGANLCFNLKNIIHLPPFYNPPGARGEDTFMSTSLSNMKVLKVPCYTFHDGFLNYKNILNGILPNELQPVDSSSPAIIKRFIGATIGWIRYKPLMVYITQRDEYEEIIASMRENLELTIPKFCEYFKNNSFKQILPELKHYHNNVKKHYSAFQATKAAWVKVMAHVNKDQ